MNSNKLFVDKLIKNMYHSSKFLHALYFAWSAHLWQKRIFDGSPYINHPLDLAMQLWWTYQDEQLSIAALLHDTVEDCESVKIWDIYDKFWSEIGYLVDALTNTQLYFYPQKKATIEIDSIDKIIIGGTHDVRVFLIKIADREYNLKTSSCLPCDLQERLQNEHKVFILPLKRILGDTVNIDEMKWNLNKIMEKNHIVNFRNFRNFLKNMNDEEETILLSR